MQWEGAIELKWNIAFNYRELSMRLRINGACNCSGIYHGVAVEHDRQLRWNIACNSG